MYFRIIYRPNNRGKSYHYPKLKWASGQGLRLVSALFLLFSPLGAKGDVFGAGANSLVLEFTDVGNPGNPDDQGSSGIYSSPYGGVSYPFRMGVYEVSENQFVQATSSGLNNVEAGAWTGDRPASYVTWYEAAAFVNWLNETKGFHRAYDLTFDGSWHMALWNDEQAWSSGGLNRYRHKDAFYFLPTEDEWYKAAYHKNDGITGNYWDYATGSDGVPDGIDSAGDSAFEAVFWQGAQASTPNVVTNAGVASPYGTRGQNGNVREWCESAYTGQTTSSSANRVVRGGYWQDTESVLRSSYRASSYASVPPSSGPSGTGFRVAAKSEIPGLALRVRIGASGETIVDWDAQPGIIYRLLWAAEPTAGFEPISADLQYPEHSFTDTTHQGRTAGFYRLIAQ